MISEEQAVHLLQEIIRIDTVNPPGNELRVATALQRFFEQCGIESSIDEFVKGRANLLARMPGNGERGALVLCGHMDVVPAGDVGWSVAPFEAVVKGDRLYGRGACDMKSGLVAMAVALANLHAKLPSSLPGDVWFAATAGEEADCCGAQRFLDQRILDLAEALVVGEPTREEVLVAHKGALWLEIETFGRTAHGSMPDQGVNAIVHMHRVLERLVQNRDWYDAHDDMTGHATMCVSRINGGLKINVVPDSCVLHLDVRTVAGQQQDNVVQRLREILERLTGELKDFQYDLRVISRRRAVRSPLSNPLVTVGQHLYKEFYGRDVNRIAAPYFTDASVIVEAYPDLPVLFFGPGDDTLAHQPDEWVSIQSFLRSIKFYERLIRCYFQVSR